MRLVPLEIGRIRAQLRAVTGDAGETTFPVPAWLIEHRDGLALFDTGMHRDLQQSHERIGEQVAALFRPDFHPGEELSARLRERSVRPGDIDMIILSHLHFDHAGGCCEVPDGRIVVQQKEWEAGHDPRYLDRGYDPDDYNHGHDVQQVDGEHDVFGDGRVVCVPTPGHTPGHQSLRVELDSGPVVLTGDCIYLESMLDDLVVPPSVSERAGAQQRDSMRRLAAMRADGARLIFGHDEAQFRALPAEGLV